MSTYPARREIVRNFASGRICGPSGRRVSEFQSDPTPNHRPRTETQRGTQSPRALREFV